MPIGQLDHSSFISSKYLDSQSGYNYITLPYQNTIFFASSYPFIMINENHVFDNEKQMNDYFTSNPTEKVADLIILIGDGNNKSFYQCDSTGVYFVNKHYEISSRIKQLNAITIYTEAQDLNFYINGNKDSLYYIPANSSDGWDYLSTERLTFVNCLGKKFAFQGMSY